MPVGRQQFALYAVTGIVVEAESSDGTQLASKNGERLQHLYMHVRHM